MDAYFKHINAIIKKGKVSPRVRFLLLDVVELRERQWVPRPRQVTELKTIDQVWVWLVGGCGTHHLRVSELISKFVHN